MRHSHLSRRSFIAASSALAASAAFGPTAFAHQEASPASPTSYPVTVSHDGGETTLEQAPERIVALEWHLVEDLLVLGIQPTAIADVEGFKTWVTIDEELGEDVQDVGTRQEPSLEALAAAEPDLILGLDYRDIAIYDQLNDIAPTILMSSYPQDEEVTPLENVRDRLRQEGWFLDRAEEADAAIAEMDDAIAAHAAAIEDAGLSGTPFVITQAFTAENQPTFRIFSDQALVADAISATGLENVWTEDGGDWGFTTNTIEAFIELPEDVYVFYIINDTDDIRETFLNDDPIWQSLPFVQEGRFLPLGGDTWTFGGTQSVERIVNRSTEQITGGNE